MVILMMGGRGFISYVRTFTFGVQIVISAIAQIGNKVTELVPFIGLNPKTKTEINIQSRIWDANEDPLSID